ncbi:MAG: hypothetical protein EAZ08_01215 [Cytophagales bacterium]|nr:MAG: hypothetical protein EAZ08_01215 [Cytophagales bacterium]
MENNIDKLFKNKLLQHQEQPSEQAWKKLEEAMYGKQAKQRSLGVYWRVAAAIALLLTACFFYFGNNKKEILSAKQNDTPSQLPIQIEEKAKDLEVKTETQPIGIEEVKTYQPSKYLAKSHTAKNAKTTEKIAAKPLETKLIEKEETLVAIAPIDAAAKVTPKETEEQEIRITVKFADEATEPQEIGKDDDATPKIKKTWLGKMMANRKKKRQEEQAREGGEHQEKPSFSVFGIDTEKVFAKKKMAE